MANAKRKQEQITFTVNITTNVGLATKEISCMQNEVMSKAIEAKDEIQKSINAASDWCWIQIQKMEIVISCSEFEKLSQQQTKDI